MQPGCGKTYLITGWVPLLMESPRSTPNQHDFPSRGGPLAEFGPEATHPTHSGCNYIYLPTGPAPMRRDLSRNTPHPHAFTPRYEALAKFGPQPSDIIPHRAESLAKFRQQKAARQNPPTLVHTWKGGWEENSSYRTNSSL